MPRRSASASSSRSLLRIDDSVIAMNSQYTAQQEAVMDLQGRVTMKGFGLDGSASHAVTSCVHWWVSSTGRAALYSLKARTCAFR